MKFLTDEQLNELLPAEASSFPSPVPTQIVSSDEYLPVLQTEKQREVETRLKELSDRLARGQGLSRRRFFQTASGMAASFLVMNQVFGRLFEVSEAEAATPDMAAERAQALSSQLSRRFIWIATPGWRCCRIRPRRCPRTGSSRRNRCSLPVSK